MISIKRTILEKDRSEAEQIAQVAVECYIGAITCLEKHAVELSPQEIKDFQVRLGSLRRELFEAKSAATIQTTSSAIEKELREYNGKVSELLESSKAEAKDILNLLREATRVLAEGRNQQEHELHRVTGKLAQTAECENLSEIRMQLREHVSELRTCIELLQREQTDALRPLEAELESIETRLKEAERLAMTDPLTGLANRREAERCATKASQEGTPFCLIVIDLNRFKWINDRMGHHCGDQVLTLIARKLKEQVRPTDLVCRWGGDEFLIIMNCELHFAMQRSRQIGRNLHNRYPLMVNGRKVDVEISASVGVSQCQPGEPVSQAFERADAMLYQMKQQLR